MQPKGEVVNLLQVPFSAADRQENVSKMYALMQRFGTASQFHTMSFNDSSHPLVMRGTPRSDDNVSFPAVPGDLLPNLQDPNVTVGPAGIDLRTGALHKLVSRSAVAATRVYLRIQSYFTRFIVGKPLSITEIEFASATAFLVKYLILCMYESMGN